MTIGLMKWLSICCTIAITTATAIALLDPAAGGERDDDAGHGADPRADERDHVEQAGDHADDQPERQVDDAACRSTP